MKHQRLLQTRLVLGETMNWQLLQYDYEHLPLKEKKLRKNLLNLKWECGRSQMTQSWSVEKTL